MWMLALVLLVPAADSKKDGLNLVSNSTCHRGHRDNGRSETAREKPECAAGYLAPRIIVGDFREQARSYKKHMSPR